MTGPECNEIKGVLRMYSVETETVSLIRCTGSESGQALQGQAQGWRLGRLCNKEQEKKEGKRRESVVRVRQG